MNKSKKITLIISIALVSILLIVGISYAAMSYNKAGSNQQLVLGDIWMKYDEVSGLSISDALPGDDYSNYFEFTISGKNTYTKKDIYYDFILNKGDLPEGKTEDNRIPDEYLKFKLVSVDDSNQETVIFQDETYESLENQRIYVETIAKNTTDEVNRKYRLYMTIDYSLEIGNTSTAVFTMDEWEQAFATVKLNVTGDFSEKKILTYEDCFSTYLNSDGTLSIGSYYKYNASSTNELYQNPLCTSDVVIPSEIDGVSVTNIGYAAFRQNQLTSVVIPDSVTTINMRAFMENWSLTSVVIPDSVTTIGEWAFAFNSLENIEIPDSVTYIGTAAFNSNGLSDSEAFIYARTDNNGDGIAEIDTTEIISYAGDAGVITIPDGVKNIGNSAFQRIYIIELEIPNSVTTIGENAFNGMYQGSGGSALQSVIIPPSVTTIGSYAFANQALSKITLSYSEDRNDIDYGYAAFPTHGSSYAGSNKITKVYNIGDVAFEFDWDSIFDVESIDDTNNIASGIYKFYFEDEIEEIEIITQENPTPASCFTTNDISSTEVEIIDYDTSCGLDVVIPYFIDGKVVTKIGTDAFYEDFITSVVIPDSVSEIGSAAFSDNNLTSVVIPNSVTTINNDAFNYNELTTIVIGSSVSYIGQNAFPTHSDFERNRITSVINKSGNAFDWDSIFELESSDGNNYFVSGTYNFYYNGDQTIEIIDAYDPDEEHSEEE